MMSSPASWSSHGSTTMLLADRPAIPAALKREVLVEAGHRCAIPRCQQVPVEIHHIESWATCRSHEFENLIALCPVCHARAEGHGGQLIDKQSLRQYKANLSILSHRYSDYERRALTLFSEQPHRVLEFGDDADFYFMHLLRDGLIAKAEGQFRPGSSVIIRQAGRSMINSYRLTPAGHVFIQKWMEDKLVSFIKHRYESNAVIQEAYRNDRLR